MNELLTMEYYIGGIIYLVVSSIILYPFLNFLIEKVTASRWLQRICYISILIIGWYLLYSRQNDLLFFILMGAISISFLFYQVLADRLCCMKKRWRACIEIIQVAILLFGSLYIVAYMGDFRLADLITGQLPDGGYTFIPGYLDDMILISIVSTCLLIGSKYIYLYFIENEQKKKQQKIKDALLQKELVQAQLDALHAKINPHFLYNSLNTIAGLALVDGEKTRQMALALSRFFRYSINKEQTNLIRVIEEIEMVKTYLDIEKIRFGEQLNYSVEIAAGCDDLLIPRMLLQPLVENCVKHGWKGELKPILIEIQIKKENSQLVLSIKDNGAPFPAEFVPGYGFKNINDKLELLFPEHHKFEILTKPEKEVRIAIMGIAK